MMPLVLCKGSEGRILWNLSADVGLNAPNQREDVHLVQFAYSVMALNPKADATYKAIYAAVKVGIDCSGRESDPLVVAIRAHQKSMGGNQDGRVSVIKGDDAYYGKNRAYVMVILNNNLFDAVPYDFPRLDKHPKCPPLVRDRIKSFCTL